MTLRFMTLASLRRTKRTSNRARIDLHLKRLSLPHDIERGAVARVIPLDSTNAQAQEVVIPAGKGQKVRQVTVPKGTYVVQTKLPSGSLIQQVVAIDDSDETKSVTLEAEPAPHSWLAMQAPAEVAASRKRPAKRRSKVKVSALAFEGMRADTWPRLGALGKTGAPPKLDHVRSALGSSLPVAVPAADTKGGVRTYLWEEDYELPQTVIVVERGSVIELVPLPLPWITQHGEPASVECAVPDDPSVMLRCTVRDPDFGAVLGHLVAGSLRDARKLLEPDLKRWLDEKRMNPYAAALAACVLVKTETSQSEQPWDSWIDNLAAWFPALPDGTALQGVRRLRRAKTAKDLRGVRDAFAETLRRGIPIFAPVATMFLDGLATLVGDESFDSGELDAHLPAVRSVFLRMQSGHAFSVLRYERR